MAFFSFRRGTDQSKSTAPAAPAQSVELMRKRAKQRLIGSVVLVLVGVVGFPLLFDTQPRPIPVDIPIDIPNKKTVKPLTMPIREAAPVVAAPAAAVEREEVVLTPAKPVVVAAPAPSPVAPAAVAPAPVSAPAPKVEAKVEPKAPAVALAPVARASAPAPAPAPALAAVTPKDDGSKAKALLEGTKPADSSAASSARLVVQVGAFAEVIKAREARLKVEKAGMKTYTQVVETKDGKRIRVRVGPFTTRADADKAAAQIKALGLTASVLTL